MKNSWLPVGVLTFGACLAISALYNGDGVFVVRACGAGVLAGGMSYVLDLMMRWDR